jgi:putative SOS response-associated peptidase YedK
MSSHYESLRNAAQYPEAFGVPAPAALPGRDIWPRRPAVFIRQASGQADAAAGRELVAAQFGLTPSWSKSASDAKLRSSKLVNARASNVQGSKHYDAAWTAARRCIVPMSAFFVDDWRSGRAVPTRIARVDGRPMGAAGLWESWSGPDGECVTGFALLTVDACGHGLLHRYAAPGADRRMPVILNEGAYDAWLSAPQSKAKEFMRTYPANWLTANPVEQT